MIQFIKDFSKHSARIKDDLALKFNPEDGRIYLSISDECVEKIGGARYYDVFFDPETDIVEMRVSGETTGWKLSKNKVDSSLRHYSYINTYKKHDDELVAYLGTARRYNLERFKNGTARFACVSSRELEVDNG